MREWSEIRRHVWYKAARIADGDELAVGVLYASAAFVRSKGFVAAARAMRATAMEIVCRGATRDRCGWRLAFRREIARLRVAVGRLRRAS